MTVQPQSAQRREVEAAARRYRREGYKVSRPDQTRDKPSFLGDLEPDLIAERDDDKVVIEVKYASAVRGANDIVDLAKRVAGQPGWRFELIALRSVDNNLRPNVSWGGETVSDLIGKGFLKPAFIVVYAMMENLLAYAALHEKMRTTTMSSVEILKALAVRGVIDDETRECVRAARTKRNALMHDPDEPTPSVADIKALMQMGRSLERNVVAIEGSSEAAP